MSANPTLTRWNTLPAATAAAEILHCCGSRNWANSLVAERPFEDLPALLRTSDRIWRDLSEADWLEAFRSHPRIGESHSPTPASAQSRKWSTLEQSRFDQSPESVKKALTAGNQEYERKFARIFIICATGKSAAEILQNLQRRLQNDQAAELHEAAEQQREITHIRLRKWLTA
ncbi:MAG: 2-oxo-4-hydroxy-4-carboxy-5-ureidoimidazoline decarboxylase [Acidobacteria bacterium]|nr:2-oxo-4-hydroxy-4-carboxy-5-ureidoimidazoline decarboxylase [Acidobacteriota bacterium]